jgi:serine/threonine protein kinase
LRGRALPVHLLGVGFGGTRAPGPGDAGETVGTPRPVDPPDRRDERVAIPGVGARVGHYILLSELGRGGMGTVFLARDEKLQRKVAIKFVAVRGAVAVARFTAEARVTARCTHANIVVVHDIGEHEGVPYMVLEYVEGESLLAVLQRGAVAPARTLAIALQAARALAYAHSRGIVHRDFKPANVLLAGDTVKIVDFGIAKSLEEHEVAGANEAALAGAFVDATMTGDLVGTLHYMAPEQVRHEPLDDRVDSWALGVTMYQMLCGRRPFADRHREEMVEQLRNLDVPVPPDTGVRIRQR